MNSLKKIFLIAVFASASTFASSGKVLIVLSSADHVDVQNAPPHPTGYFLDELATSLGTLKDAGYEVTYANPNGNAAVMDAVSDKASYFDNADEYQKAKDLIAAEKNKMDHPRTLASIDEKELLGFDGIFLPGGHAPMQDLVSDKNLRRILKHFHRYAKPTALICHAPVALLSAKTPKEWIYKGYEMTMFSNAEEEYEESINAFGVGGKLTYHIETALRDAGAKIEVKEPNFKSEAVSYRELITGRNPQSAKAFTKLLIEALTAQKVKKKRVQSWNPATDPLRTGALLNVMDKNPDWNAGYSTLYIGKRKAGLDDAAFISGMETHIRKAKAAFEPLGLKGYIVYIENDHEIAYQNWVSDDPNKTGQQAANAAFATPEAQEVFQNGAAVLDLVWFDQLTKAPTFLEIKIN